MINIYEPLKNKCSKPGIVNKTTNNIKTINTLLEINHDRLNNISKKINNTNKKSKWLSNKLLKEGKMSNQKNKSKFEKTGQKITPEKISAAKSMN